MPLFNNNGKTIKIVAIVNFIVETILIIAMAIYLMIELNDFIFYGILMILIGPGIAYVTSSFIAGYGELITNTKRTVEAIEYQVYTDYKEKQSSMQKHENDACEQTEEAFSPVIEQPNSEPVVEESQSVSVAEKAQLIALPQDACCMKCGHVTKNIPCDFCGMTGHIGGNFFYI